MKHGIAISIAILCLKLNVAYGQFKTPFNYKEIGYNDYIELVKDNNLEYAAEKLNIKYSEAAIEAARIFQDPYISADWTNEKENSVRTGYGFSTEIGKTIELGGRRNARIDLSLSEKNLTEAMVADYFRNLRAEATLSYLEAMKQKELFKVRYDSYETMKKLSDADSIRLKLGSIMEIDAIQSRLEKGILYNELIQALAQWKNSLANISLTTGLPETDSLLQPSSHLHNIDRDFSLNNLITTALNNRTDLIAASLDKEVSEKNLRLTHKERGIDMDLRVGISNSYLVGNASPSATGINAGISIPLKISNIYNGDIQMAEVRIEQADEMYKYSELLIRTEIIQAWELYQGYCQQVRNFNVSLLEDADKVRTGKIYSYQRGETSLLEVLNAQRTYNDIQTTYYETIFNRAAALVELEKSAGIWDINF